MSIKALVVHGYGYNKNGWLGLNELVCQKAAELWKTGEYDYLLLPAGVNEDTGEGRHHNEIIADRQLDYLILNYWRDIPPDMLKKTVLWSPECAWPIASDTMTECVVTYRMIDYLRNEFGCEGLFEIHAVGVFPHSLKIQQCWNAFIGDDREMMFGKVYHVAPWLDSRSETVRQFARNVISTAFGMVDPFGEHWPATVIKKRRRDLHTPKHLRDRVIF